MTCFCKINISWCYFVHIKHLPCSSSYLHINAKCLPYGASTF